VIATYAGLLAGPFFCFFCWKCGMPVHPVIITGSLVIQIYSSVP
jgi:hypothetical protein